LKKKFIPIAFYSELIEEIEIELKKNRHIDVITVPKFIIAAVQAHFERMKQNL
jgi:hypothetical protein